jgi:PAS domain S-box-containing protein
VPSTLPSPPRELSAEQRLARERAILQYVVDNVPYCIFWKDHESRYLGCNKNFAALDGLSDPREMVGKTDYDTAWREHAEDYRRFDRETMERGVPLLDQEEITHDGQGRQMVILTSKVPLRNDAGDVIGLLGIIVDITQRKQIERDLSKAKEQAERALRSKNDFLANISHELRTPLTLVKSPLESLLSGDSGELPGAVTSQIQRAHRNALRLLGMVDDLLDFSRLEAGKQDVLREPTDVPELCASIVDDAQPLATARSLTLEFQSNLAQAVLLVDRGMLEKITLNLVGNALKFTPPGGTVHVALGQADGAMELVVSDTGIGIDASSHARVFERFQQVDPAATRRYGGMGLGLALVKEFAELMGGSVTLESELGKGCRFVVSLPLDLEAPLPITSGVPLPIERRLSSLGGTSGDTLPPDDDVESTGEMLPRLLLVEDNADMRSHLAQLLRGRYRVSTADNGQLALDMLRAEEFDVVLSDLMMPVLDGLSLVEIAKSDEQLRHIPIILITARSGKDALVSALETGADDYIAKPFSPAELRARVRAAYRLGHAHRRLAQLEDELRTTQLRLERAETRGGHELDTTRPTRRRAEVGG